MKSKLFTFFAVLLVLYLLISALLYFFQEKMIFFPQRLAEDFIFEHYEDYEERYVEMQDGTKLHALLFTTEDPKGLIFYLHGNAGSLEGWGSVAETFTANNYDVFIPDYRGYGKSGGAIESEAQLHEDMQTLYDKLKEEYPEDDIIVLGHSIGSGMAARLAVENHPKLLILQAPPYSLPDLAKKLFPFSLFPQFLIRYKFETGKYIAAADVPVIILHGDEDEIVYYGSSLKLKKHFKPEDTLITLKGLGHNNLLNTEKYRRKIAEILERY
ncbi:alpha/beta hydrolase [Salinimicrobium sp. CAU 1759]